MSGPRMVTALVLGIWAVSGALNAQEAPPAGNPPPPPRPAPAADVEEVVVPEGTPEPRPSRPSDRTADEETPTPEPEEEPTPQPLPRLGALLPEGGMANPDDPPSSLVMPGGGSRPDTYTIVRGDTLWGISSRFWGDPYFWPKLWSYNPEIGNAHFIYPGEILHFSLGSPVRIPGMEKDGPGQPLLPEDGEEESTFTQEGASGLVCAPPMEFVEDTRQVHTRVTDLLKEGRFKPIGQVIRSPEEKEYLLDTDIVYLRFSKMDEVECGDVFSVYRPTGVLRHPEGLHRRLADVYQIVGDVKVLDVNDLVATARIINLYTEVQRGDLITDFTNVYHQVPLNRTAKEVTGHIVEMPAREATTVAERDVVFIDLGEDDGVDVGDTFYVLRQGDGLLRYTRADSILPEQVVGKLVVITPARHASVAVVTESTKDLEIGDRISMELQ